MIAFDVMGFIMAIIMFWKVWWYSPVWWWYSPVKLHIKNKRIATDVERFILRRKLLCSRASCERVIDRYGSTREDGSHLKLTLGVGSFPFMYENKMYTFQRWCVGKPLPSNFQSGESCIHNEIVIFGPDEVSLHELCKLAAMEHEDDQVNKFWMWNAAEDAWESQTTWSNRCFETVILARGLKTALQSDIESFTNSSTREWYEKHQIPYRRGYLLHGPPGTGKTSTVCAIATKLKKDVHRLSLVSPSLDDDSLTSAVYSVDDGGIIVMEDLDSLFGHFRTKTEDFRVTFSGLLNAIDGIQDATRGVIFVFTTNHTEGIDPALRRPGRVDLEFCFTYCSREQAIDMFLRFYEGEEENAQKFASNVMIRGKITPAQLQSHFILNRENAAADALELSDNLFCIDEKMSMFS